MSMNGKHDTWRLAPDQVRAWMDELVAASYQVMAPVERNDLRVFRRISSSAEVSLESGKTQWSAKDALFPRTETLFTYRRQGEAIEIADPPVDDTLQILVGVRPCDAAGFARLDHVLGPDPFFARQRARTRIVTLACAQAEPECFCTAVGGAPDGVEGSDVELRSIADGWLLRAVSEAGASLVGAPRGSWRAATPEEIAEGKARSEAAAEAIRRGPIAADWSTALAAGFDHPVWQAIGRRCVGCSICAYVCPSCSCFDVQDEGNATCGTRCRSWDSCTFSRFTLHASGHNPRPDQPSRYRQRVLHKFSYFPAEHEGQSMCVGCGRCLKLCPTGLDIHQAVEQVMAEVKHVAG